MKTKILLITIVVLSLGYVSLSIVRAIQISSYEDFSAVLWQIGIVLIAGISFGLIVREILFGIQMQKLARLMNQEQMLLPDTLSKLPSGRTERTEADARFSVIQEEVERQPENWRGWFRLGLAYDEAGDRRRARASMRHSLRLFKQSN
ncbi:MAG: hypothetical protein ACO24W_01345 [Candidatus Nanopelagicales bacterium]